MWQLCNVSVYGLGASEGCTKAVRPRIVTNLLVTYTASVTCSLLFVDGSAVGVLLLASGCLR